MVDTWILVRDIETNSERNRGIYILKSRGMNHSTQVREFVITDDGLSLLPIYISADGILTGSAKLEHTLQKEEEHKLLQNDIKSRKSEIERKRKMMEENIALLKNRFDAEVAILNEIKVEDDLLAKTRESNKLEITDLRNKIRSSSEKSKSRNK